MLNTKIIGFVMLAATYTMSCDNKSPENNKTTTPAQTVDVEETAAPSVQNDSVPPAESSSPKTDSSSTTQEKEQCCP